MPKAVSFVWVQCWEQEIRLVAVGIDHKAAISVFQFASRQVILKIMLGVAKGPIQNISFLPPCG